MRSFSRPWASMSGGLVVLLYLIMMPLTSKYGMGWKRRGDAPGICGLLLGLTLCASTARAQAPEWEVDASEYQYSASLFFAIVENGVLSADGGNLLGFFDADGTCRGSSGVTYIESTDSFVGGMLVHFNQVNPELTALVYVNSMDTIIQAEPFALDLVPQASNGSIFNPVLVAVTYDVPSGCTSPSACNFNAAAQADGGLTGIASGSRGRAGQRPRREEVHRRRRRPAGGRHRVHQR